MDGGRTRLDEAVNFIDSEVWVGFLGFWADGGDPVSGRLLPPGSRVRGATGRPVLRTDFGRSVGLR